MRSKKIMKRRGNENDNSNENIRQWIMWNQTM